MSDFVSSLKKLISVCEEKGVTFVSLLEPGRKREEILQEAQAIGLTFPEDLIELYEYCDGVDATKHRSNDIALYSGYWLLPLHHAVQDHLRLQQDENGDIDPSWFPLLTLDGDYYFVDCALAASGEPYVINYTPESDPEAEYTTLQSMIETFADCFRENAFVVSDGKIIEYDGRLEAEITRRHNPEVQH